MGVVLVGAGLVTDMQLQLAQAVQLYSSACGREWGVVFGHAPVSSAVSSVDERAEAVMASSRGQHSCFVSVGVLCVLL